MTPEEKYHNDRWFVLQKIREKELYTPPVQEKVNRVSPFVTERIPAGIEYRLGITPYSKYENPPPSAQINILRQLKSEGAIEILHEKSESGYGAYYLFILQIKRPKFDELYEKHRRQFDIQYALKKLPEETAKDFVGKLFKDGFKRVIITDNLLTTADKKKICVLEKLKEKSDLTPQTPVRTHIHFGYSYVRPAGEARLDRQELSTWIEECNLSGRMELENILAIFQQNDLISKFIFSEQEDNLKIQFPEDFERRYNEYKAEVLNTQKLDEVHPPPHPNLSNNFADEMDIQRKAIKKMIEKEDLIEEISGRVRRNTTQPEKNSTPDTFVISVKDREIWVNEWLLSKPHAVGSNYEFFEYVRSKPAHTPIKRSGMPNWGDGIGYGSVKEDVKNKSFIKMVNELGFKGEILKAFFYKRSRDSLTYYGDEITKEDLEKAGVKTSLFLKELELAHTRNSPE